MITEARNNYSKPNWVWLLLAASLAVAVTVGWLIASFETRGYVAVAGLLGASAILLLTMRYERLSFYLLVAALPLAALVNVEGLPNPVLILFGGLAFLVLLLRLATRQTTLVFNRATGLALLIGLWAILSGIDQGGVANGVLSARPYLLAVMLFFVAQNSLRRERHFVEAGWLLVFSLGITGAIVFGEQALSALRLGGALTPKILHSSAKAGSVVTGIGETTSALTKGLPFAFYLGLAYGAVYRLRRYLLFASALFIMLGTLATVSVNAFIGLGVTLVMVVAWLRKRSQQVKLATMGLMVLAGGFFSPLGDRITKHSTTVQEEDVLSWGSNRGLAWYTSAQMIGEAPWLGRGPRQGRESTLDYLPNSYQRVLLRRDRSGLAAHNMYLTVAVEIGLPGLLVFLALLAGVLLRLWTSLRHQRAGAEGSTTLNIMMGQAILIGLVAFLVQGTGVSIHLHNYLWLLLGAGSAFTRLSKQPQVNPDER
jgi:O-antigen ligase